MTRKTNSYPRAAKAGGALIASLSVFLIASTTQATYVWTGATSSDFQTSGNWSGTPPTANSSNGSALYIQNGANSALNYTASEGSTTFSGSGVQLLVGTGSLGSHPASQAGTMTVTGGTLNINDGSGYEAIVGQVNTGTLNVSNGAVNLTGKDLWIGNEVYGNGTVNLSNGTVTESANVVVGRDNAAGLIDLTGGNFVVQGTTGTTFFGGTGSEVIKLDLGTGTYKQTGSGTITFSGTTGYLDFVSGSQAQLSLLGATQSYFDGLVNAGRIKIDGATASPGQFQYQLSGGQGVYSLATTPEPASLGVLGIGALGLLVRRRK